ncbi:MAG TPA: alpha/beta hydrolase [Pseudonocardiaceae bacterium]|nr:alpha/beta hydrolase [Pseudonocardiaceae bacterium]
MADGVIVTTLATSDDGTRIGFRTAGSGPGLVVLHGTLRAAQHYHALADALAADFTVHSVDRRGRGHSGAQGDRYDIDAECADLAVVLAHTGATMVFAHSYGGLVALETVLRRPDARIERLAVQEPALSIDGAISADWLPDLERAIAEDRTADGVLAIMIGLDLAGELRRVPVRLRKALLRSMLQGEMLDEMRALLPTVAPEVRVAIGLDSSGERYAGVGADTLLLAGQRSPAYLREVTTLLTATLPRASAVTIPNAGHNAPDMEQPLAVAEALRAYFT